MQRRLILTLALSSLLSLSLVHAAPKIPTTAQLLAQLCASRGDMAALVTKYLSSGVTYQHMLDQADKALADSNRSPEAITINRISRHIITTGVLNPHWTEAQARTSAEMACLRGE